MRNIAVLCLSILTFEVRNMSAEATSSTDGGKVTPKIIKVNAPLLFPKLCHLSLVFVSRLLKVQYLVIVTAFI